MCDLLKWENAPSKPGLYVVVRIAGIQPTCANFNGYLTEVFEGAGGQMFLQGDDGKLYPPEIHKNKVWCRITLPPLPPATE